MTTPAPESKFGSMRDLVVALCGEYVKTVAETISRHAKERPRETDDDDDKKRRKGLDSIPVPAFMTRLPYGGDRGRRFSFNISPTGLIFFKNLIALDSALGPQLASEILRGAHRAADTKDLLRRVAAARSESAVKFQAYGSWLTQWKALEARLFDDKFDPKRESLMVDVPGHRGHADMEPDGLAVPFQTLHVAKQLEEIDRRVGRDLDGISAAATKALLLLQIGEEKLAAELVESAIADNPDHFLANYAYAQLYLGSAATAAREANYHHLLATDLDAEREHYHQPDVDDAMGRYIDHRQTAFRRLAVALQHWPAVTHGNWTGWHDHQKRGRVIAALFRLAFEFAHDHGNVDWNLLHRLSARRSGTPVEHFFEPSGLDAVVLEVAKEVERYQGVELQQLSSICVKTMVLQLYFALAPEDYERFLPIWCAELAKAPPWSTRQLLNPGWQGREFMANVAREHLQRAAARSTVDIAELCSSLEHAAVDEQRKFYADVQTFLTKDRKQTEDDDFESWE